MKSYKIEIDTQDDYYDEIAVGHFIKEPYFVIEKENGDRLMILNAEVKSITIDKDWLNED